MLVCRDQFCFLIRLFGSFFSRRVLPLGFFGLIHLMGYKLGQTLSSGTKFLARQLPLLLRPISLDMVYVLWWEFLISVNTD